MNTKATDRKYLIFVGLSLLAFVTSAAGAGMPKTNLITFLSHWREPTGVVKWLTFELEPQWVGTVKRAYLRDPLKISRSDEPTDIRFSHLFMSRPFGIPTTNVSSVAQLHIVRGRVRDGGHLGAYLESEGPIFRKSLPSVQSLSTVETLADLEKLLGPRQGLSGGWGGLNGTHTTAGWTFFTVQEAKSLRYLNVSAHISSRNRFETANVEILRISEGDFRPAARNSDEELAKYKTGEEVFAEEERRKAERRAKFPQPLRSFLEARETPDDSDLKAYTRALNSVRAHPDPELFRQLVGAMEEDLVTFDGYIEDILLDQQLDLKPWQAAMRRKAIRALGEAIPHAKSGYALESVLTVFLRTEGGGKFIIPSSKRSIEVRPTKNGFSQRLDGELPRDVPEAAAESYRKIKQRYLQIWSD